MTFPPFEKPNPLHSPPSPPQVEENPKPLTVKPRNVKIPPQSIGDYIMKCCGFRKPPKSTWIQLPTRPPPPEPIDPIEKYASEAVDKIINQAFLQGYGRLPYPEGRLDTPPVKVIRPSIDDRLNEVISSPTSSDKITHITADKATRGLNKLIKKLPCDLTDEDLESLKVILKNPEKVVILHLQNNRLLDPFQFLTILNKTKNLSAIDLAISPSMHNSCRWELNDQILAETWVNNCLTVLKKNRHSPLLHTLKVSHAAPGPLRYLLERHPDLLSLDLIHCPDIRSNDFEDLSEVCKNLNSLLIRGENNDAGKGIACLIANNPELDTLKIANLKGFSKKELIMIAKSTSDLKKMKIYGTDNIHPKVLATFRDNNPGLQIRITMKYKDRRCLSLFQAMDEDPFE